MKPLILLMLLSASILAQNRVVGDKSQKVYWAFGCVEARLVPFKDYVEFADKAAAEKEGYRAIAKCGSPLPPIPGKPKPQSLRVRELTKQSAPLSYIAGDFDKYKFKTVRVIGHLSNSGDEHRFGNYGPQDFWEFSLSSLSEGTGYFYMRKTIAAENLRQQAVNVRRGYADCQVRLVGVTSLGTVYGDLIGCKFWTFNEDDDQ